MNPFGAGERPGGGDMKASRRLDATGMSDEAPCCLRTENGPGRFVYSIGAAAGPEVLNTDGSCGAFRSPDQHGCYCIVQIKPEPGDRKVRQFRAGGEAHRCYLRQLGFGRIQFIGESGITLISRRDACSAACLSRPPYLQFLSGFKFGIRTVEATKIKSRSLSNDAHTSTTPPF